MHYYLDAVVVHEIVIIIVNNQCGMCIEPKQDSIYECCIVF